MAEATEAKAVTKTEAMTEAPGAGEARRAGAGEAPAEASVPGVGYLHCDDGCCGQRDDHQRDDGACCEFSAKLQFFTPFNGPDALSIGKKARKEMFATGGRAPRLIQKRLSDVL